MFVSCDCDTDSLSRFSVKLIISLNLTSVKSISRNSGHGCRVVFEMQEGN